MVRLTLLLAWFLVGHATARGQGDVQFVDVTVAAGVDYLHFDGVFPDGLAPGERDMLTMSAGAAAGDYDGDGWADLYVTRMGAPNLLYRNRRDGTFEEVGAASGVALDSWSTACAWADIDGDRDLDLYVLTTMPSTRAYLYVNDGTGSFTEEAKRRGLAMVDPAAPTYRLTGVAFGDPDRDGDLDAYLTEWHFGNGKARFLENRGGGRFRDATVDAGLWFLEPVWGFTPRFADVDDDGWPDLLVAADFGTSRYFHNERNGSFLDRTASAGVGSDENGMGSAVGDVDGDGRLDWFVTSIYDDSGGCGSCGWGLTGNRLYRNLGRADGVFADATDAAGVRDGSWGWGAALFDPDNDGDLDLAMTNGVRWPWTPLEDHFNDDAVRLWENDGSGTMREVATSAGLTDVRSGKALVVLDFDRDGDQDVFVANAGDHPVLFENVGGNATPWLQVALCGERSTARGCGARVSVRPKDGGPAQVRELSLGGGYMGQDEPVLHFGLGEGVAVVHEVRVRWPASGRETVLKGVAANRRIIVCEGAGDALPR